MDRLVSNPLVLGHLSLRVLINWNEGVCGGGKGWVCEGGVGLPP